MKVNKKSFVVWFTGLPCSGKTTIANALSKELRYRYNLSIQILDGDEIRKNLTSDLGFSKEDRNENIKRVGYVAKLLCENDINVIAAFVSPYKEMRKKLKESIWNFVEVYIKCSIEECKKRDIKGMYAKAIKGEIKNFTGIDDPYEVPINPDIVVETDKESIEKCVDKIIGYLAKIWKE